MATILFDIAQATGHLNPSFRLAKLLQAEGHKIVYASSEEYEKAIRSQGFEVLDIYRTPEVRLTKEQQNFLPIAKRVVHYFVKKLLSGYLEKLAIGHMEQKSMGDRIKQVIELQPDLIIADSMNPLYRAVVYCSYSVEVVMLQTMMSPTQAPGVPPLHSRLVPHPSRANNTQIQLSWLRHYGQKYLRKKWRKGIYFSSDIHTLSDRIMKKCGLPESQLDRRRTINDGLKGLQEISLAPRALDFPRGYQDYEVPAGYAVDVDRVESSASEEVERLLKDDKRPLVYCSLGTISTVHNARSAQWLKKVIRAVRHQPWDVLIATGSKTKVEDLGNIPVNVRVYETLPQLAVLKRADVMVTHGGLNSVVECILHEVPMVVCPLNNKWDQNGNAARVVYHGLGVRSQLGNESVSALTNKIDQVLKTEAFRENVRRMKGKVIKEDQHHTVVAMIETMLTKHRKVAA